MNPNFIATILDKEKRQEFLKQLNVPQEGGEAERPWGFYVMLSHRNDHHTEKYLVVTGELSLQYHEHRDEFWTVHHGELEVFTGEKHEKIEHTIANLKKTVLKAGETIWIPKGTVHTARKVGEKTAVYHEIQYGKSIEADNTRLYDCYGRVVIEGFESGLSIADLHEECKKKHK